MRVVIRVSSDARLLSRKTYVQIVMFRTVDTSARSVRVIAPEYLHRVEYRRMRADGAPVHEYTETVEDMGWCLRPNKHISREQWFVTYTRACAEDYLERVEAPAGTWVVLVRRLDTPEKDRGRVVGSIKLKWPPRAARTGAEHR